MAILPVGDPPSERALERASHALRAGDPVVIPTDTVYGVVVDAFQPAAIARLFAVKRRPGGVPIALLVAGEDQVAELAGELPRTAARLVERFWPGGLTVVVPQRPGVGLDLGDAGRTVGLRCPDHAVARRLAAAVGPIAATSANRHGEPTLPDAAGVTMALDHEVTVVLDGGRCTGAPSTVVDCTGAEPKLLREGSIPFADVLAALP